MSSQVSGENGFKKWEEFEAAVIKILGDFGEKVSDFNVLPKQKYTSFDGEYEIDASVKFSVLGGAEILILVECKNYKEGHNVERDEILELSAKLQSIKAQKGMIFTTSNFQESAIEYATQNHISLIRVVDESVAYVTKSFGNNNFRPLSGRYLGYLCFIKDNCVNESLIRDEIIGDVFKIGKV